MPDAQAGFGIGREFGLNTDDLHFGMAELDRSRDAADQSAAAHRDQHSLDCGQVFEDFKTDRALAGDDLLVVVGRNDHVAMFRRQLLGAQTAFFAARAHGDDLRPESGGRFELVLRSIAGHDDDRFHPQGPRRISHPLRVIAAGVGDDSPAAFGIAQRSDLVVSPAQLEGADGLQVLELQVEFAGISNASPFQEGRADGDALEARLSLLNVVKRNHYWSIQHYLSLPCSYVFCKRLGL